MATASKAPWFVGFGNAFTITLLRAGVKIVAFRRFPMYLLTVRGRKSGQPHTLPIVIFELDGRRYVGSPYGMVNWVHNLRAAREATLTRGRHSETVSARELPIDEAAHVLRAVVGNGNPFAGYFGVSPHSSPEDYQRAVASHPYFELLASPAPEAPARDVAYAWVHPAR